ncbi:hypothetical protein MRBLWO14_001721 [Microbacterium sp. LWO14-1.2]|uniref:hypothetical protein n=1 Tax=Microbacterium sp. LWO14-1.2 TaxID=3135263 RepID=UPI003138FA66
MSLATTRARPNSRSRCLGFASASRKESLNECVEDSTRFDTLVFVGDYVLDVLELGDQGANRVGDP